MALLLPAHSFFSKSWSARLTAICTKNPVSKQITQTEIFSTKLHTRVMIPYLHTFVTLDLQENDWVMF